jgi:hypothetical protein
LLDLRRQWRRSWPTRRVASRAWPVPCFIARLLMIDVFHS